MANVPAKLKQTVASYVAQGYVVEAETDYYVIVTKGRQTNHVLHCLLTILTIPLLCFWLIVWIAVTVAHRKTRYMIKLGVDGNTIVQQLGHNQIVTS